MTFSRSGLPDFEYSQPTRLAEALTLLDRDAQATVYLGGTDLFPRMRKQIINPPSLIDLKSVSDFPQSGRSAEGELIINPQMTLSHLISLIKQFPGTDVLLDAIQQMGTPSLRNRATLAGNLCNASPAADSAAPMIALGGRLCMQSVTGSRELPIGQFLQGPAETALGSNELVTEIIIPVQPAHTVGTYLKISRNKAADLAICGVAVCITAQAPTPSGFLVQIVVSGANPVPVKVQAACDLFAQQTPALQLVEQAARLAAEAVNPISDVRSSREYRRAMVYELTLQALTICLAKHTVVLKQ